MISTTELSLLYALVVIDILAFGASIFCWYVLEADKISIASALLSLILSFKISNIFIDGTLTRTSKFLNDAGNIVTDTEVIRNSAASGIFEFMGICVGVYIFMQLYDIITENRGGEACE